MKRTIPPPQMEYIRYVSKDRITPFLDKLQGFPDHNHVIPEHQELIIALFVAERTATKAEIIGIAQPGRIYRVRCSEPADLSDANRL